MKRKPNYIIMPVNQDMSGGNIFGDIWSGVKDTANYVVNKLPSTIGDAVIKGGLISKAAGFIPVVGQPTSAALKLVGLGKKKKRLMGKGLTTIKNKKRKR